MLLAFVAGLIISIFYTTCERDYYKNCSYKDNNDRLRFFISGSIICWFILPIGTRFTLACAVIGYANIIFDAVKYLRSLIGTFLFYAAYFAGTLAFHIVGIYWVSTSSCVFSQHYNNPRSDLRHTTAL